MSCVTNILANLLLRPPRYDYDDLKNLRILILIQPTTILLMQECLDKESTLMWRAEDSK